MMNRGAASWLPPFYLVADGVSYKAGQMRYDNGIEFKERSNGLADRNNSR